MTRNQTNPNWLREAVWTVRLYFLLIGSRVRSQMQYKSSFTAGMISDMAWTFFDLTTVLILFAHIRSLAGWTVGEMMLLFGLNSIAYALSAFFAGGFDFFFRAIRLGQFDTALARPMGTFTQVLTNEFQLRRFGRLTESLIITFGAILYMGVSLAPWQWLVLVGAVIGGTLVYSAILLLQATACFWTVEGLEVFNILTSGGNAVISRPLEIFDHWMRWLFMYLVPLAFTTYFPARLVLGKQSQVVQVPSGAGWLSVVVGVALFALCKMVWEFGVRHYQSTGS